MRKGLVFVSPDILAVYQVMESEQVPPLARRDESGGGGRFLLQVKFLDTRHGQEMRLLRLTTNSAESSGVYPTHDGKFVVRTGDFIRLYSASFEEIASKALPRSGVARHEGWRIAVAPSGRRIYAVHTEIFGYKEVSRHEAYLLDAETLESVLTFDPGYMNLRPLTDWVLIGNKEDLVLGIFNPSDRTWRPVYFPKDSGCGSLVIWTTPPILGEFDGDRKRLQLCSLAGEPLFSVSVNKHGESLTRGDPAAAGRLFAYLISHPRADPFDLGHIQEPLRITVYDLDTKSERCSILIDKKVSWLDFAITSEGAIAIIRENALEFYRL